MTDYPFEQIFAADPSNPANIAAGGVVTIYAPGDATKTPIPLKTLDGNVLANPIQVNRSGFGPAYIAQLWQVAWDGGGFSGVYTSNVGLRDEAQAAVGAAQSAQAAAESAAGNAATGAAAGASASLASAVSDAKAAKDAASASAALVGAPADTAISAAVNGAGTATKAALNAAFGLGNTDGAQTAVLFGDSIIAQCEDEALSQAQGFYTQYSWTNWAQMFLGYGFKVIKNSGIGGNTTTQMLARIDTDVKPYPSDWVIMDGGVNDIFAASGISTATTIANLTAIFETITRTYGRKVMMMLPTGSGYGTAPTFTELYKLHRWLKTYAREHRGIYLFDGHGWYCDPADGMPIAGYARPGDAIPANMNRGVHPGFLGAAKIGRALADAFEPHLTKSHSLNTATNADTLNLVPNGRMVGNVSGLATGWALNASAGGSATGVVATKVPRWDGKPGEAQQVIWDGVSSGVYLFNQNTDATKWVAGDNVYAEVEFETDPDTVGSYSLGVSLQFWNGLGGVGGVTKSSADGTLPAGVDVYPRRGVSRTPVRAIPAGTARLQLFIYLPRGTTRIVSVNIRKVDY